MEKIEVTSTECRSQDTVGISVRKQGEQTSGTIVRCHHCKQIIPPNRWRVINKVKRGPGKGYIVREMHLFHAKMALSQDEYDSLLKWLKSSTDVDITAKRSAWIQAMNQGIGKKTGTKRRSSLEWFNKFND